MRLAAAGRAGDCALVPAAGATLAAVFAAGIAAGFGVALFSVCLFVCTASCAMLTEPSKQRLEANVSIFFIFFSFSKCNYLCDYKQNILRVIIKEMRIRVMTG